MVNVIVPPELTDKGARRGDGAACAVYRRGDAMTGGLCVLNVAVMVVAPFIVATHVPCSAASPPRPAGEG